MADPLKTPLPTWVTIPEFGIGTLLCVCCTSKCYWLFQ